MEENAGKLITLLYRKSQIFWNQYLKDYHITSAEYPVLISLHKQDGLTQEELTARVNIDKSAIARVVQSLEEKGFVKKKKDEHDKRCNRVCLTEQGKLTKEPIQSAIKEWNGILMRDMQIEEKDKILSLLSQMVNNIRE